MVWEAFGSIRFWRWRNHRLVGEGIEAPKLLRASRTAGWPGGSYISLSSQQVCHGIAEPLTLQQHRMGDFAQRRPANTHEFSPTCCRAY